MPNYSGKWTPSQILQARGQDLWPINGPFFYVDDVFSTYLYVGNASVGSTQSNGLDLSGEGGLVWAKIRDSGPQNHLLFDTERGGTKVLYTNQTSSEQTGTDGISFLSDGWSTAPNGVYDLNNLFAKYVSWSFRKQAGFFDIQTWTGDGTNDREISHNLGSVPGFIIIKSTSNSTDWVTYHRSYTYPQWIRLNSTDAQSTTYGSAWSSSNPPTSTAFTLGSGGFGDVNYSGRTYVAYIFAHDDQRFGDTQNESIIKCGSYSGNGLTTGNEITLGFEPQWLMVKRIDSTGYWAMMDIMRGITDSTNNYLQADSSAAEQATGSAVTPTATGFNILTDTSPLNNSSGTYIYVAIRRPMMTPTAATEVFAQDTRSSDSITTNFPVDAVIGKNNTATSDWFVFDRLRKTTPSSSVYLKTNSTAAETSVAAGIGIDSNTSIYNINSWSAGIYYNFKRATGFFDVVAYTGTGSTQTINHNLGVVPELIIVKSRSYADEWPVYSAALGNANHLTLNTTSAQAGSSAYWDSTTPTASVFTVGARGEVNTSSATYIAYLFATLDGISKVGSYTGTAADLDVDCGFTSGARFILIKRTDATGFWYVYDSVRGIVTGNDPFLLIDQNYAETTTTDYVDPLSSGFTVTSSASGSINTSGGEYIFLAIA